MKTKIKDIAYISGIITAIIILLWFVGILTGCSTTKWKFPDGSEFLHQPFWFQAKAKKVDCYYERTDPNGTGYVFWLIVDDPNRSVNPGRLKLIEPRTKIEGTLTAGETK